MLTINLLLLAAAAHVGPAPVTGHGTRPGATSQTGDLEPCLLVVAAPGTKTANDGVNEFWHTVNADIAGKLVARLAADGGSASLEQVPRETSGDDLPGIVALALARERCGRLMDLRHTLGGGSGPEGFFGFHAKVLGVTATDKGFTLGPDLFEKTYRFPLNDETLKTLSMAGVAATIAKDLGDAGMLSHDAESAASDSVPASSLDEATVLRLLGASPEFTGDNSGRQLVRVIAFEHLSDDGGEVWIAEVEWKDGDAVRTGIVPTIRESEARGKVLHIAEGWALFGLVPDVDIETAVKGLRESRIKARESAALGDVRTIISAQAAYSSIGGGAYGEVRCLKQPGGCLEGYEGPVFLHDGFVTEGEGSGYVRAFHPGPAATGGGLGTWAFTAAPSEPGAGSRGFCGDATGRICATADGSVPPVEGGLCAASCPALE